MSDMAVRLTSEQLDAVVDAAQSRRDQTAGRNDHLDAAIDVLEQAQAFDLAAAGERLCRCGARFPVNDRPDPVRYVQGDRQGDRAVSLSTPVAWPRRRYLTTCRRHPECAGDAVMGARCLGYVDAVVTGTPAPEWPAEDNDDKLLRDALATLERSGWPVSSGLAGIPEPETLPTLLPEGLQGIRTRSVDAAHDDR